MEALSLKGIFPALITPFHKNGGLNEKALADIIKLHIKQGVKGFYVTGSTGECHLLSLEERMRVVEICCQETRGKAVMIVHVGTMGTEFSVKLAEHAAKLGADAISSIPPIYYKYSADEVHAHYAEIASASGLPLIIYNIPALTGTSFTPDDIGRLAEDIHIAGVKYTDYNLYVFERMKKAFPELVFYSGHDEVLLAGLSMGADGAIGSTYNFMYPKVMRLKAYFDAGDYKNAFRVQTEINEIIELVLKLGNMQSTKFLMNAYGIDCGECRKPAKKLGDEDKRQLELLFPRLD